MCNSIKIAQVFHTIYSKIATPTVSVVFAIPGQILDYLIFD